MVRNICGDVHSQCTVKEPLVLPLVIGDYCCSRPGSNYFKDLPNLNDILRNFELSSFNIQILGWGEVHMIAAIAKINNASLSK